MKLGFYDSGLGFVGSVTAFFQERRERKWTREREERQREIDSILRDPEKSLRAARGRSIPIPLDDLIASILRSPEQSAKALDSVWGINRDAVSPYESQLVEKVTEDGGACYLAGRNWSDEVFFRYADDLVEGLSPRSAVDALKFWNGERYFNLAPRIAQTIVQDSFAVTQVFRERTYDELKITHWADRKFPVYVAIAQLREESEIGVLREAYDASLRLGFERTFLTQLQRAVQVDGVLPWAHKFVTLAQKPEGQAKYELARL